MWTNWWIESLTKLLQTFIVQLTLVIGPQNTEKSILFNPNYEQYVRGIYDSLIKSNRPEFDYMMWIDTKDLLSNEKKDSEYNRRVILFCMVVSHLLIVITIDEINQKLTINSLNMIYLNNKTIIYFVLNQNTDSYLEKHTLEFKTYIHMDMIISNKLTSSIEEKIIMDSSALTEYEINFEKILWIRKRFQRIFRIYFQSYQNIWSS